MNCSCGSEKKFENCCEPFLRGKSFPQTAEELMRSRYTAFTLMDIEYIKDTTASESQREFDSASTLKWAKESKWKGLKILSTKDGGPQDQTGTVEFTAIYNQKGNEIEHHEVSKFKRDKEGHWKFVDGDSHSHKAGEGHHHDHSPQQPIVREEPKVGRNDPCPCGSGKKYKKCCG